FGFDWGVDEHNDNGDDDNGDSSSSSSSTVEAIPTEAIIGDATDGDDNDVVHIVTPPSIAAAAPGGLPPGVVVHRVAASDRQANPHGTTESELLEPMVEDKAKQLQATALEHEEANLSPLEVFCQRSSSVFIFQRVWAAKEVGRLLQCEARDVALGVLVPIAMRLADDRELFVRETMAQNLLDVLSFYYESRSDDQARTETETETEVEAEAEETEAEEVGTDIEAEIKSDPKERRLIVPPRSEPSAAAFGAWLHGVLLSPHPSVSLAAQRAAVGLGRRLSFARFHTEIVHGVVLGLAQNNSAAAHHQALALQRSKDMVVKPRGSSGSSDEPGEGSASASAPASVSVSAPPPRTGGGGGAALLTAGLASLFGRRGRQSGDKSHDAAGGGDGGESGEAGGLDALMGGGGSNGFFVSPADEQARVEATRRKLLMLHMIHLVAAEFGAGMRPAVFVPVVERAAKDRAFEVRRDAAAVLGSLAKAVSCDLAHDVLFPAFARLAQDAVWQVRQSAARHALPGLAL
ncbi:hypothetical protein GGI00_004746, partial [Coemansia sp. RSA 2681]